MAHNSESYFRKEFLE